MDKESTHVVDMFYADWLEGNSNLDTSRSALALHEAVRKLKETPGHDAINWATYVHYGV
jgi:hypothetical protein